MSVDRMPNYILIVLRTDSLAEGSRPSANTSPAGSRLMRQEETCDLLFEGGRHEIVPDT